MESMGFSLWIWTVLALGLFWGVGVYNRITRLRARSLELFTTVAQYLFQYRTLVTLHVDVTHVTNAPPVFQQLLRQMGQLDIATKGAQLRPWDRELLAAIAIAGAEAAATWGILRTAPADLAGAALPDQLMRDWDSNSRVLYPAISAFNQILRNYNEAIGQFPALMITKFLGFEPAGQIVIFHEA
jgi:LemA protein